MSEGRVLVAGASGVIGIRLCRLLVQDGWLVTGVTRSRERAAALSAGGVDPVVVDVFDEAGLRRVLLGAGPAVVVHQLTDLPPALDPARMPEAIIRTARIREVGTRHLIAAALAANVGRMVAQSVAFAYAAGPMPYAEDAPLNLEAPGAAGTTARGVASLERQVLTAPLDGLILRYGKLYGPGTGFDDSPPGGALHVDAAADAARRAVVRGQPGSYNIAEEDGSVSSRRAMRELGWEPGFRIHDGAG